MSPSILSPAAAHTAPTEKRKQPAEGRESRETVGHSARSGRRSPLIIITLVCRSCIYLPLSALHTPPCTPAATPRSFVRRRSPRPPGRAPSPPGASPCALKPSGGSSSARLATGEALASWARRSRCTPPRSAARALEGAPGPRRGRAGVPLLPRGAAAGVLQCVRASGRPLLGAARWATDQLLIGAPPCPLFNQMVNLTLEYFSELMTQGNTSERGKREPRAAERQRRWRLHDGFRERRRVCRPASSSCPSADVCHKILSPRVEHRDMAS